MPVLHRLSRHRETLASDAEADLGRFLAVVPALVVPFIVLFERHSIKLAQQALHLLVVRYNQRRPRVDNPRVVVSIDVHIRLPVPIVRIHTHPAQNAQESQPVDMAHVKMRRSM